MTVDITALTYTELVELQKQVNASVECRKPDEAAAAKKEWLASDEAQGILTKINALRKTYDKISSKCGKSKSVNLKVKMTVEVDPRCFDDILDNRWEMGFGDVFEVECGGELTNKSDCGDVGHEIQDQIDNVMADVCEDAVGVHGTLKSDCDAFIEDLNELVCELRDYNLDVSLADIVEADTAAKKKAAKKKTAKKGK